MGNIPAADSTSATACLKHAEASCLWLLHASVDVRATSAAWRLVCHGLLGSRIHNGGLVFRRDVCTFTVGNGPWKMLRSSLLQASGCLPAPSPPHLLVKPSLRPEALVGLLVLRFPWLFALIHQLDRVPAQAQRD